MLTKDDINTINKESGFMHSWGDDWPHWNELHEAEKFIGAYVYKWSRCRLQSKEKWGTLRYEHIWPPTYGSNGPIIPLPFPLFSKTLIINGKEEKFKRFLFFWTSSWLYYKWMKWGDKMLGRAVNKAYKKFPNVIKEIRADLLWRR